MKKDAYISNFKTWRVIHCLMTVLSQSITDFGSRQERDVAFRTKPAGKYYYFHMIIQPTWKYGRHSFPFVVSEQIMLSDRPVPQFLIIVCLTVFNQVVRYKE